MAQKIDPAQVRQVAKLSRLDLSDDQIEQFSTDLSSILGYIEKLNELDTDSVEPLAHCLSVHNVFRDDVIKPSLDNEKAIRNAPDQYENYFRVPKILDDNSGA